MQFKTKSLFDEWVFGGGLDSRIRDLVAFVDLQLRTLDNGPCEAVITSLIRSDNPNSVHAYGRGADIRTRDWPDYLKQRVADAVNLVFQYDPDRPHMQCAMIHDVGQGEHLHLQVHPNSRWIPSTMEVVG